ncbi:hypothetical protein M0804_004189 [Polistes exclamans]|nr:hypothetical protein M0804_004189 [Polistes exclamans]
MVHGSTGKGNSLSPGPASAGGLSRYVSKLLPFVPAIIRVLQLAEPPVPPPTPTQPATNTSKPLSATHQPCNFEFPMCDLKNSIDDDDDDDDDDEYHWWYENHEKFAANGYDLC